MVKRVYRNSVLNWAKDNKLVTGSSVGGAILIGLYFMFLAASGAITITDHTGDMICEEECYLYLNFTANEDIFIYPLEYDPYDRNVGINFDPNVTDWKLERSWGSGWREIDLNDTCKGTWCGAPAGEDGAAYSYAFREGRDYEMRITVDKEKGKSVKWTAFGVDPYLLSSPDDLEVEYSKEDLMASINVKDTGDKIQDLELGSHPNVNHVNDVSVNSIDWNGSVNPNAIGMWYESNSVNGFENALGTPEFINMKNGELVDRDWRYVIWGNETYSEDTYECSTSISENGTETEECVVNGTVEKTREAWLSYDSTDLKKGKQRIGIEVEVKSNDHIDGVWNVGGKKISRHAEWQASLETDLVSWYTLNETSGSTAPDMHGTNDGTYDGDLPTAVAGVSLITDNAQDFDGEGDEVNLSNPATLDITGDITLSAWFKTDVSDTHHIVAKDNGGAGGVQYSLAMTPDGEMRTRIRNTAVEVVSDVGDYDNGTWVHGVAIANGSDVFLYVNGVQQTATGSTSTDSADVDVMIGSRASNPQHANGSIDEVGIWSRALTQEEITTLYNEGEGCTYQSCSLGLGITLLSPEDNANLTSSSVDFDINVSTGNPSIGVTNLTIEVDYANGTNAFTETNTSALLGNYTFTNNFTDGDYDWTAYAYGNDSVRYNATETRSFSIDSNDIILNSPADAITINTLTQSFNATITDFDGVTNVSLVTDGTVAQTNTSGLNNTDYIFEETFTSSGQHTWLYRLCDIFGFCTDSAQRTLTIELNLSGTVEDSGGSAVSGADVYIVNQSDDILYGVVQSNSTGHWTFGPVLSGNYTITGYDPTDNTKDGDADPWIEVP